MSTSSTKQPSVPGLGWATLNPKSVFQLGKGKTLAVPMEVHKCAREKLCDLMASRGFKNGVVLLKGGEDMCQYDSDTEVLFRQDSWFNYLWGAKEPGLYGAIDLASRRSTLFIPRLPAEYAIWCGAIHPPSHFCEIYGVDEVLFVEDLCGYLTSKLNSDAKIHVMDGVNSDSGLRAKPATFEGEEAFSDKVCSTALFHALATARVTKSPQEIVAMHYCALVASNAHFQVMRAANADMSEYQLEATFLYEIYKNGGCRRAAYTSICACGPNGAVLHYGHAGAPNDRSLVKSDMCLLDMGAEYHGYVSDITCSFPLSGTFTSDQRAVYEGVLNAQQAVLDAMKPGVSWSLCHQLAEKEIIKSLLGIGILQGGTVDELANKGLGAIFFPHGLGHLIGCDTHDVGGYIEGTPERSDRPGLRKLRTARILEANMCLTNEPGCYFIDALLDSALADPVQSVHINNDVLARFRGFGGVRLEDVVQVTEDGVVNLTTCPRTVKEVESVLSGGAWPPAVDEAKGLRRQWVRLAEGGYGLDKINL